MAGYLITIDDIDALRDIFESGIYSTNLNRPRYNAWRTSHEGTFADYLSMKEGDLVFFFNDRKIYGCGRLVNTGTDCKYFNYLEASSPWGDSTDSFNDSALIESSTSSNRCFCTFEPSPAFFCKGIDMDSVLQHKENPFRSVRTLWKLSFIKMDDDESEALQNIIIKENEDNINIPLEHYDYNASLRNRLIRMQLYQYQLNRHFLISGCTDSQKHVLNHEMALEAALCEILTTESREPFGRWDYISHQVAASPFKPVDYMDKMDIFGYRYIPGYKIKSKYIIAELKKDAAVIDIVDQIMKYVDWVSNEYANKDYSMIEAYLVASEFSEDVINLVNERCIRNYTKGVRPAEHKIWNSLKLVKYIVQDDDITFTVVE